jgi:hypothetical protein
VLVAVFSIIGTYVKSTGDKATPFEQKTAVVVLVIAAVLAWLKLIKRYWRPERRGRRTIVRWPIL